MDKKAQGIIDFVVLLLIVIAALLIMGYYVRNTISGKLREGGDTIGQGEVYRPWVTSEDSNIITNQ